MLLLLFFVVGKKLGQTDCQKGVGNCFLNGLDIENIKRLSVSNYFLNLTGPQGY